MQILDYSANSIHVLRKDILMTNLDSNGICLQRLRYPSLETERIAQFRGSKSNCLTKLHDLYFISIDNKLFASRDLLEWKVVLELEDCNFIWHMCQTKSGLIAQEYGNSPTYLHTSRDGFQWKKMLSNKEVDSTSTHWHSVAYDSNSELVYATLGDGNIVKAIKLEENSPWQP